ncbi:MAG: hypothetical protein KBB95_19915 [Deltaproteobacteria bacterium]|nr:hypothetical protein [Deltaproteobacteria bacterium]
MRQHRLTAALVLLLAGTLPACSSGPTDPGPGDQGAACVADPDCDDGAFCNGVERCNMSAANADARGCSASTPPCSVADCDEDEDTCAGVCPDGDSDGHPSAACGGDDCDDADASRFPGNLEVCDLLGHDEDCDMSTLGGTDSDRDAFVDARCCNPNGSGGSVCGEDCNDARRNVHPLASEVCDYVDNNCDGLVDDGVALAGYRDRDQDSRGDALVATMGCPGYPGFSTAFGDCDDQDPARSDTRAEACDGVDNDCDTLLDEDSRPVPWYSDSDSDGFGLFTVSPPLQCDPPGAAYSIVSADCNDTLGTVNPLGVEVCNGRDDDCNGRADFVATGAGTEDDDGDGFGDTACGADDCNDLDFRTHPGAFDFVDGRDNDCDGEIDECAAPGDCEDCGDGSCGASEDARSCPFDCAATCPDGLCTHAETATSCAADCACGENERVASGVCVACETGYLRPAGDDASRADTECAPDACILSIGLPCGAFDPVYVKASNTDLEDGFGYRVAIEGDLVMVSAPGEDSAALGVGGDDTDNDLMDSGAVYAFRRGADQHWTQEAYLKPGVAVTPGYAFGTELALDGDTLVVSGVGARFFVYVRAANGSWAMQQELTSPDSVQAVAVSGDTLAVAHDGSAAGLGHVYVYTRDPLGVWSPEDDFTASNLDAGDLFGDSLALEGDLLAVSAPSEDSVATGIGPPQVDNGASGSGAVYIFERVGSSWSQTTYIKASNAEVADEFGASLAFSGDTLAVGARWEDSAATGVDGNEADNARSASGAVYVFVRAPNGTWSQQAYIKASNPNTSDYFGSAVWVDGDTLIVGAPEQNGATTGLDAAATTTGASNSGAAYVFARDGLGDWTQRAYVKATNAEMDDEFGDPVCVSGDTIVVGVPFEDSNATGINGDQADWRSPDSGAVYVWRLPAVP